TSVLSDSLRAALSSALLPYTTLFRSEHVVHAHQEAGRGARRGDRIAALVDQVVDAHEEPSGPGHELPDAGRAHLGVCPEVEARLDRKSTRLNSSHEWSSYAVFCLKKK